MDTQQQPHLLYDVAFRVPGFRGAYVASHNTPALARGAKVLTESSGQQRVGTVQQVLSAGTPLGGIVQVLSPSECHTLDQLVREEEKALDFCRARVSALNLPMKVVAVETEPHNHRSVFYFSSADRVDFRLLVKDLAREFHTRIELRQIGVRDATRYVGGIGLCGRKTCCSTFLPAFQPISIRMAKDQNLALNQDKLSGICGRLRCCLQYEQGLYQDMRKGVPKLGKRVVTPLGEGRVKDVNVLLGKVRVQMATDNTFQEFSAQDIQPLAGVQDTSTDDTSEAVMAHSNTRTSEPVYKKKKRRRKKSGPGHTQQHSNEGPLEHDDASDTE